LSAAGVALPRASSRPRRVSARFGSAFAVVAGAAALGFAHAYASLAPLAGSESPESLLLLVPLAAAYVLWRQLAHADRDGGELAVNLFLATPALIVLAALLLWFPPRLSYFYWVYRLDLLAVPFFVAFAVLLVFGATALWRARWAIVLLLLGWPPHLDAALRLDTARIALLQAELVGLLPLRAARTGTTFVVGHGAALTIGAPCAGLLGVVSMLLVGGVVVAYRDGPRRRKLAWLAGAVAVALAANVVRLALVVAVAAHAGVAQGFAIFHALAGPLLFALALLASLLLLDRVGLPARARREPRPRQRVELGPGTAAAVTAAIAATALVAAWTTAAAQTPGLFRGVIALGRTDLLPTPAGYSTRGVNELASLGSLFGTGAQAQLAHIGDLRGDAVAAQVVVTPTYRQALRYGVLDCFVFHHDHVYATHVEPLVDGGSAMLTAVRLDGADVATLTWVQPALVDGRHAWRRVLLFSYLNGVAPQAHAARPASSLSVGSWLLDRFGPYGATTPPPRFRRVERGLVGLADELVAPTRGASA
jgi:exosortase/archaeosortase family protein